MREVPATKELHLSKIARFLKESITLKKSIDRLYRNSTAFDEKQAAVQDLSS